jgi:hypothetical protein
LLELWNSLLQSINKKEIFLLVFFSLTFQPTSTLIYPPITRVMKLSPPIYFIYWI